MLFKELTSFEALQLNIWKCVYTAVKVKHFSINLKTQEPLEEC